jgi:exodeoxyribonuclease VII large subunit
MRRAGQGDLYAEFLRIKEKLQAEGWFASDKKLPIPQWPRAIGILTSLQAAALRDVLTTLARRAPHIPVVIYPIPVQGAGSAEKIRAMLSVALARAEVDVLLLVRGGGSIEDLWAFNDETLAREIARASLPIISGVGHETDFTIADFVASARAATPTAAANLAVPDREALLADVRQTYQTLTRLLQQRVQNEMQKLDLWQRDLLSGRRWLERWRGRLGQLQQGLHHGWQVRLQRDQQRLKHMERALDLLNPQHVLGRGYSLVLDEDGRVIQHATQTEPNALLQVKLAEGELAVRVLGLKSP